MDAMTMVGDAVEVPLKHEGDEGSEDDKTPVVDGKGEEVSDFVDDEIKHALLVSRIARLRDQAWEAVVFGEFTKLDNIARALSKIKPTGAALAETGAGHLMADKSLWNMGGNLAAVYAKTATQKWKAALEEQ